MKFVKLSLKLGRNFICYRLTVNLKGLYVLNGMIIVLKATNEQKRKLRLS
jgi:hypothetical protein